SFTHVVQDGQTLWTIAAIHQISLADLLLYNGLTSEEGFISEGQEIVVRLRPGESPPPTPTPPTTYIVQAGDSLYGIAGFTAVPFESLLAWNDLTESSLLTPGMELRIVPPLSAVEAVIQSLTPEPADQFVEVAEGAALPESRVTPTLPSPAVSANLPANDSATPQPTPTAVEIAASQDQAPISIESTDTLDSTTNTLLNQETSIDPFLILGMGVATVLGIVFLILGGYFVWQGNK
ncbi:MAG: LysM peptidoglycan-binding domain-containing protein, partial [Chloroflexota bacterium]